LISIVTSYYNRKQLFKRTLNSLRHKNDDLSFEVIAVDDGSDEIERIEDLESEYEFLKVIRIEKKDKWYTNPCVPFNIGLSAVKGDIVVIQNPECYHFGDILNYIKKNLQTQQYLSFACFSLDKVTTNSLDELDLGDLNIEIKNCDYRVLNDGEKGWYNHSKYRPVGYHFCAATHTENIKYLGGFDERYARGIGFDDDEFLYRVKGIGLEIKIIDDYFVLLHQNHYTEKGLFDSSNNVRKDLLLNRNKLLFENVTKSADWCAVNYIPIDLKNSADFKENRFFQDRRSLIRYFQMNSKQYGWKGYVTKFILKMLSLRP